MANPSLWIEIVLDHGVPPLEQASFLRSNGAYAHTFVLAPSAVDLAELDVLELVVQATTDTPAGDDLLTQAWFGAGNRTLREGDKIAICTPTRRAVYRLGPVLATL